MVKELKNGQMGLNILEHMFKVSNRELELIIGWMIKYTVENG